MVCVLHILMDRKIKAIMVTIIISLISICIIAVVENANNIELSNDVQDCYYIKDTTSFSQNEHEIITESHFSEVLNDNVIDSVISMDSEIISSNNDFLSAFGYVYEEVVLHETGLICGPSDCITELWTNEQFEKYYGTDIISSLDSMLDPLTRRKDDANVILCADGTVWAGNHCVYTSPDGVGGYVIIYCNRDSYDHAFQLMYSIGQYNNTICGNDVWLGHLDYHIAANEKSAAMTDDLLLAAFQFNGVFYSVASYNLCETDHLRAIHAILN